MLDQDTNLYLIVSVILITGLLDNVSISYGEVSCSSLLDLKIKRCCGFFVGELLVGALVFFFLFLRGFKFLWVVWFHDTRLR